MSEDAADMERFIKKWKPRILRHQAYKVSDINLRVRMYDKIERPKDTN